MTLEERKKLYADDLEAREAWEKAHNTRLEWRFVEINEWSKEITFRLNPHVLYRLPQKTDKEKLDMVRSWLVSFRDDYCRYNVRIDSKNVIDRVSDILEDIS